MNLAVYDYVTDEICIPENIRNHITYREHANFLVCYQNDDEVVTPEELKEILTREMEVAKEQKVSPYIQSQSLYSESGLPLHRQNMEFG